MRTLPGFRGFRCCSRGVQSPASGWRPPGPRLPPPIDRCCPASSSASRAGCRWLHPMWGCHDSRSPQSEARQHGTGEGREQGGRVLTRMGLLPAAR